MKRFSQLLPALAVLCTFPFAIAADGKPQLVPLDSDDGARMLRESTASGDFHRLIRYFSPQKNLAYCGVASSVMVLNALPVPKPQEGPHSPHAFFTQENFFSPEAIQIKAPENVAKDGMSLEQLGKFLNVHPGVRAVATEASATSMDDFRKAASSQLNDGRSYVLVNYLRKALGQNTGGHISPLGAWHEATDSFLIIDVSQYKYPPVWVTTADLWKAMLAPAGPDGKTRGFVIVSAEETPSADKR